MIHRNNHRLILAHTGMAQLRRSAWTKEANYNKLIKN